MKFPDRRTLNVLLTVVCFALALALLYVARTIIIVFAFSILFAYLINPVVQGLLAADSTEFSAEYLEALPVCKPDRCSWRVR